MNRRLPVTLIGGFLGAGKTSLLHHIISEHRGGYLAVLVENPGPLNLDAKAIGGLCGAMRRQHDAVLAMPSGDEVAQAEWMGERLQEWAKTGRFERVLIEVAGVSNPARLARFFQLPEGEPQSLAAWAHAEQIVCVVDALEYFQSGREEAKTWREFQNAMIAGATLVVLNKCDLLEQKERDVCLDSIHQVQSGVRVIETAYGEVAPEIWAQPASRNEWDRAAVSSRPSSSAAPPLACALYRAWRPLHPARFWEWFNADHPGLLRAKGIIWLATRSLLVGGISRMRWQNGCGAAGIWWAALPREEWPQEAEALARMQETWREPYGDRRQEIVLIGEEQALQQMSGALNACLLTDEELARPLPDWSALPDPFPAWDVE